ncbi:amidohydrolase [Sinanaerobacter chloroacetimidivorans]|uniref:Amidohydrolase n=1 Tax=Sinanaerobacter chloroacetimidivorans TaxID=2818044 RepID=A0A8J7W027_9FIRM|nr:amidohydrolase [Sinanaerobacter chloroacetimidivorans]MBR0597133.1 amidohydrolase [Sinanaerobacter chloroacetimidivorans]
MSDKLEEIKHFLMVWNDSNEEKYHLAAKEIWENPELSMQEFKSSAILIRLLEENGFIVEKNAAGMPTAFIAAFGEGKPVIGINAEYDALPGLSQSDSDLTKTAIKTGAPGHGCGHNLLGSAGVKAAIAVKEAMVRYKLPGTIKVLGSPAEELCLGKPFLGKEGCLEGFDAILDWHPWSYNKANYDSCCAYFSVKFHFKGKTAHGNSPWHGRSALDAAMLQAHAVEMLREHIYPGCPPDAANTINYTLTNTGPEFPSVVPDTTTAWYVGRFITTEDAGNALERITKCAKGAAMSTETEVERELIAATHHKIPNKVLAEVVHQNFLRVGPPAFTMEEQEAAKKIQQEMGIPQTGLATEILPFEGGYTVVCDTSEYSWNAPYAAPWIAMAPENTGWHHWGVARCAADTMGQKSMDTAAKVIALSAVELICEKDVLKRAKEEFDERLDGRSYTCLLPEDYKAPVGLNADIMSKYR